MRIMKINIFIFNLSQKIFNLLSLEVFFLIHGAKIFYPLKNSRGNFRNILSATISRMRLNRSDFGHSLYSVIFLLLSLRSFCCCCYGVPRNPCLSKLSDQEKTPFSAFDSSYEHVMNFSPPEKQLSTQT